MDNAQMFSSFFYFKVPSVTKQINKEVMEMGRCICENTVRGTLTFAKN